MGWERLDEIKNEMLDLLEEARQIIRGGSRMTYERADAYWLAHIETALTRDHGYMGSSMVTMDDTIQEMQDCEEPPGEDDEEEEDVDHEDALLEHGEV